MNEHYTTWYVKMAGGELYGSFGFDHKEALTPEEEIKMRGALIRMFANTSDYKEEEIEFISKEEYDKDAEQPAKQEIFLDVKSGKATTRHAD